MTVFSSRKFPQDSKNDKRGVCLFQEDEGDIGYIDILDVFVCGLQGAEQKDIA